MYVFGPVPGITQSRNRKLRNISIFCHIKLNLLLRRLEIVTMDEYV